MKKGHLLVLAVVVVQGAVLAFIYHAQLREDSGLLSGLTETRRKFKAEEPKEAASHEVAGSRIEKYVRGAAAGVRELSKKEVFRALSPEQRKMKLVEHFNLRVADIDYRLLPDKEQRAILQAYLRAYHAD